jgi:replicative DNA helicase
MADKVMASLVVEYLEQLSIRAENPADVVGISSGFDDLDRLTTGFSGGEVVVIASRPSMGKSSFALTVAAHLAIHVRLGVAFFSLEMSALKVTERLHSLLGWIDLGRLRTGKLRDDEWVRLIEVVEKLKEAPLYIDDAPNLTLEQLCERVSSLARKAGKLSLIVVDYVQLMSGRATSNDESRAMELGEISRGLKKLAKDFDCAILVISQVNRSVETMYDRRPRLNDLRDAGAIEDDADIVLLIYRDDYYNKESKEPGVAEIIIGKQRNGPTGTVKLSFLKSFTRFESMASQGDY